MPTFGCHHTSVRFKLLHICEIQLAHIRKVQLGLGLNAFRHLKILCFKMVCKFICGTILKLRILAMQSLSPKRNKSTAPRGAPRRRKRRTVPKHNFSYSHKFLLYLRCKVTEKM